MSGNKGKGKEAPRVSSRGLQRQPSRSATPDFSTQPIFYADRIHPIPVHGICTAFDVRGVIPEGRVRESPLHDAFAKGINIYQLQGLGREQYLLWSLADPVTPTNIKTLFHPFLNEDDYDFLHRHMGAFRKGGANSVFVERVNGGPYEKYMSMLCKGSDSRRGCSLLVAFFGRRNGSPCDCCLNRMSQNFASCKGGSVPVMVPFFECRSIPGFHGNSCANCLYHIEGHLCSYRLADNIEAIENSLAGLKENANLPSPELKLGPNTQAGQEYDFDKAREDAVGVVKGFKPSVRKIKPEAPRPWE